MSDSLAHARALDLFCAASELAPSARPAFLDASCAGDPGLRAEVESLLAHDANPPPIVRTGACADPLLPVDGVPAAIGPYEIVEKVGEGGMGVVYRAQQRAPIRREVAIKLIRRGIETEAVVTRFRAERQALAQMRHSNIAQVLDAGVTDDGRPFFAMEFVDGEPITRYCDRKGLGIRERLELFAVVCDAVQHAHHQAIIHRDIKPSNILVADVAGRSVPKVIDFGIAKGTERSLVDRTLVTEIGQPMGTPGYMSPEQTVSGGVRVDSRTDVYSLGAVLYELLAGSAPFERAFVPVADRDELGRLIREQVPDRPSARLARSAAVEVARKRGLDHRSLVRLLRRELDWVAMKALEKGPAHRYDSPSRLADDVARYLQNEPIRARPPSLAYRLGRWGTRHKAATAAAASTLILLIGFGVTMALVARRLADERDRANEQTVAAERATALAIRMFEMSIGDLEDPGAESIVLQRLAEIRPELDAQPLVQAKFIEAALARWNEPSGEPVMSVLVPALVQDRPTDHPALLEARQKLGQAFAMGFIHKLAEVELTHVLEGWRRLNLEHDARAYEAEAHLAMVHYRTGRCASAEAMALEACRGLERMRGRDHPTTLNAERVLAASWLYQGRLDEAESRLLELRARGEGSASLMNLACISVLRGKTEQALDRAWQLLHEDFWREFPEDSCFDPLRDHPRFKQVRAVIAALGRADGAAFSRRPGETLDAVREIVGLGYTGADILERRYEILRGDPEFEALLASLRGSGSGTLSDAGLR